METQRVMWSNRRLPRSVFTACWCCGDGACPLQCHIWRSPPPNLFLYLLCRRFPNPKTTRELVAWNKAHSPPLPPALQQRASACSIEDGVRQNWLIPATAVQGLESPVLRGIPQQSPQQTSKRTQKMLGEPYLHRGILTAILIYETDKQQKFDAFSPSAGRRVRPGQRRLRQ